MKLTQVDRRMMKRCFELAGRAAAAGNHAVGSVVARGEEILGEAEEETPAGPVAFAHAELLAVQRSIQATGQRRLPGTTLYTSHEPCLLCAYAIRATRVGRIVITKPTPEVGGVTSSYPILTARDISVWGQPPTVVWTAAGAGTGLDGGAAAKQE